MSNDDIITDGESAFEELSNTDKGRIKNLKWAEFVDSWRIIPRLLVAGYAFLTWKVVVWYMNIPPNLETCTTVGDEKTSAIIKAGPTTQHAALVTAVVGAAALVFAFYTNSGKDWSKPIIPWLKKK